MKDQEFVTEMKKYVKDIRREVSRIEIAHEKADSTYKDTHKKLDDQLAEVRQKCPHLETEYYPDASGNNDSWTECKWCGLET